MSLTPRRPRLVSLNALRAFEAAARLGGFRAAAEELSVTPAAVAQQVKALEDWAGAPLFERQRRGVRLTRLGARTAAALTPGFDAIGAAAGALRAEAAPDALAIAALPSLAGLWLTPRLAGLRAALPGAAISVTAMERPPNLAREPFDLALFYAPAPGAAETVDLGADEIAPVAAPAVAARLRRPADLVGETLLADAHWAEDWPAWLRAAGAPALSPQSTHSLFALALAEAEAGAGVLIGHRHLTAAAERAGRLVRPFAETLRLDRALTLSRATEKPAALAAARLLRGTGGDYSSPGTP
jgi:LysR family glycine cleavage system transcriptional activator